jgi:hypothetical protein
MHAPAMPTRITPHAIRSPAHPLSGEIVRTGGQPSSAYSPTAAVRAQLERVLAHESFRRAPCLSGVLSYIVERSLAGEGSRLKEYVLGVEALGRGDDFDPRTDTIVRVHCRRLRQRLADYYLGDGRYDRIVIEIPKGHYGATFQRRPGRIETLRAMLAVLAAAVIRLCSGAATKGSRRRALSISTACVLALLSVTGWVLPGHSASPPPRHAEPAAADLAPETKIPDPAYLTVEVRRP